MNNKEFFEKTLEIIKTDGWCQGSFTSSYGAHCLAGALSIAAGGESWTPQFHIIANLIDTNSLTGWNDMKGRTEEEVISILERAIDASN